MNQLPVDILEWFQHRGITNETLGHFNIGMVGERIQIPLTLGTYKLRRSPFSDDGPKYLNPPGNATTLMRSHETFDKLLPVLVLEGEMDLLRAHSAGFQAVCSTGGAGTFKAEWAEELRGMTVYICYDYDAAGISGAFNTHAAIPLSSIVWLPKYVGDHGDFTDYFMKTENPKESFLSICLNVSHKYYFPRLIIELGESRAKSAAKLKEHTYDLMEQARKVRCQIGRGSRSDAPEQYLLKMFVQEIANLKKKPTLRGDYPANTISSAKSVPITNFLDFNGQSSIACIFHGDRTPSLHYYEKSNKVYCFGCHKSADVLDVIMQLRDCTLSEAISVALDRTQ